MNFCTKYRKHYNTDSNIYKSLGVKSKGYIKPI